jgi:predicted alpha/beta-fold hydrolase
MKKAVTDKFDVHTAAFDWQRAWQRAMDAVTFAEFDDAVTAPLHGFANKDDRTTIMTSAVRCTF